MNETHRNEPAVGSTVWAIADGFIPPGSTGPAPDMTSHDSVCILNPCNRDATIELFIYFSDREPVGPYPLTAPARRAFHQRINDLEDPEAVPEGVDYCCLLRSDAPIVVQHTRLDSRQAENALMSTIAYPGR
jgi:hypothetical protein